MKIQLYRNEQGNIKIWVNDDLIYDMSENSGYYNPKYYPWLEPVLDDNGNQIGSAIRPKNGTDIVVIMK
jgi:hypothetical protein